MLTLRWVNHRSPAYEELVELRRLLLRAPLGLDFSPAELDEEGDQFHLGAWIEGQAVGTLVLKPLDAGEVQMRQVSVDDSRQGQGIGRKLVLEAEQFARDQGFERMMAHARMTAVPFYRLLGYDVDPEEYLEVGIPHQTVRKVLRLSGANP